MIEKEFLKAMIVDLKSHIKIIEARLKKLEKQEEHEARVDQSQNEAQSIIDEIVLGKK